VRLSWLEPEIVQISRQALLEQSEDWDSHFTPEFNPPPPPSDIPANRWARIAEHVARTARVSHLVHSDGLEKAVEVYGDSSHAIELATILSTSLTTGEAPFPVLEQLLRCKVDDLVAYGPFLTALTSAENVAPSQVLDVYEYFCAAARAAPTSDDFAEWVYAVRDGLASYHVQCGDQERAHELFHERFVERQEDLTAALAAARAFLARGSIGRAVYWLDVGSERAETLGKSEVAKKLRATRHSIEKRMS
jgi:hypothetical protein